MSKTPTYGLFVLGLVLLPGERIPLHIFEPRYRQLFADCVLEDAPFVVVYTDDATAAPVGCTARFDDVIERHADGRVSVLARGLAAVEIGQETGGHLYRSADCRPCADDPARADLGRSTRATARFVALAEQITGHAQVPEDDGATPLSYALAGHLEFPARIKQDLLETRDENARLDLVIDALDHELAAAARARLAADRAPTNGKVPHD